MLQNPHLASKNANNEIYSLASLKDNTQLKEIQDLGYNKGKAKGKIESITELMRNLNLSPEKAMIPCFALNIIHCASYAGVYSFLVYFSVFLLSIFIVPNTVPSKGADCGMLLAIVPVSAPHTAPSKGSKKVQ